MSQGGVRGHELTSYEVYGGSFLCPALEPPKPNSGCRPGRLEHVVTAASEAARLVPHGSRYSVRNRYNYHEFIPSERLTP